MAPKHLNSPSMCSNESAASQRDVGCAAGGGVRREVLPRAGRTKLNPADDRTFYQLPRFVKHVDDGFLAQVTQLYRQRVSENADVLDLMSSWVSHLPEERTYGRVVGHGLNAAELAANRRLTDFFVRDLNTQPDGWALGDASFDAVLCCVSVQYLQQPERVFAEIYRVLRPGGVCIVTFSNRLFYDKAIAAWRDSSGYGRTQLVRSYFQAIEGFTGPETITQVDMGGAPEPKNPVMRLFARLFHRTGSDPFYAVVAYRDTRRGTES